MEFDEIDETSSLETSYSSVIQIPSCMQKPYEHEQELAEKIRQAIKTFQPSQGPSNPFKRSVSENNLVYLLSGDLNKRLALDNTPLIEATELESVETCKFLIYSGANINLENQVNETAMDIAVNKLRTGCDCANLITTLIDGGADYDPNVLMENAIKGRNIDNVEILYNFLKNEQQL